MDTPQIPPPLPIAAEPSYCVGCHVVGPTKNVMFFQRIGAVLLMFNRHIRGRLCRSCINAHFTRCTLITSFLGWWGIISFILTPFFLLNNVIRYLFCLPLQSDPERPAKGTGLAVVALLVGAGALVLLAMVIVGIVRSPGVSD